ncbi:MAG: hypothetical protein HY896_01275 [Deltaproteobacteria bacterium]|nr:hypothetical protein [Deltaproteobacteria bacterium]
MSSVSARLLSLTGVLFALCVLPARPGFPSEPTMPNPHAHFMQAPQCPRCHIYDGAKLVPDRVATASVDFCLECHTAEARGMTHPVKVHPVGKFNRMKVPPEYRLGDGDYIICLTCHTAHGPFLSTVRTFAGQAPDITGNGPNGAPLYRTYYLRRTNPSGEGFEALCEGCHKVP